MDGARYRIGWSVPVNSAMKLWSPRSDTNASVRPSGDHAGDSLVPRAKNADSAGFDPSIGAIQIRLVLHERHAIAVGRNRRLVALRRAASAQPPAVGTDQTCIFGWIGTAAGSGSRLPSAGQFDP